MSELASFDLTFSISSQPHHLSVPAIWLLTPWSCSNNLPLCFDRLPSSPQILLPWLLRLIHKSFWEEGERYIISALLYFAGSAHFFQPWAMCILSAKPTSALHSSLSLLPPKTIPIWSHGSNVLSRYLRLHIYISILCYWKPPWQSRHHSKCITLKTELVLLPRKPAPLLTPLLRKKGIIISPGTDLKSSPFPFFHHPLYVTSYQILWTLPLKCLSHSSFQYLLTHPPPTPTKESSLWTHTWSYPSRWLWAFLLCPPWSLTHSWAHTATSTSSSNTFTAPYWLHDSITLLK